MSSHRTKHAGAWLLGLASILATAALALPSRTVRADNATQPAPAYNKGVLGYWKHLDDDTGKTQSIFRLWVDKGKLIGRIEKVFPVGKKKAQTICSECEGKQHNKPVVGLIFFWGFERDEDNNRKWVDGKILNPEDGNTYHCEAELSQDGKTLSVFGYVRILFKIGGSSVWHRPTPAELQGIQ